MPVPSLTTCPVAVVSPGLRQLIKRNSRGDIPSPPSEHVHLRLVRDRDLQHAKPAHGAADQVVGGDRVGVDLDVGDVIRSGRVDARLLDHIHAERQVRSAVPVDAGFHGRQAPVFSRARLVVNRERVPLGQRQQRFLARVDQPHGPAGLEREQAGMDLGGDVVLSAEPAADRRHHDPHLVHRQPDVGCDLPAIAEGILRGGQDVQHAHAVDVGQPRLGFHRQVVHRLRAVGLFDDEVRLREAFLDAALANRRVLKEVVGVVDPRRAWRQCVFDGEDAGKRLILDLDALDCLARNLLAVGGHDGHGVREATYLVLRQHALVENGDAVAIRTRHVVVCEHGVDALERLGLARVDRADVGVRVRAPQNPRVEHPRHRHVTGVDHLARDLLPRVEPRWRRADESMFGSLGVDRDHVVLRAAAAGPSAARIVSAAERTAAVILL